MGPGVSAPFIMTIRETVVYYLRPRRPNCAARSFKIFYRPYAEQENMYPRMPCMCPGAGGGGGGEAEGGWVDLRLTRLGSDAGRDTRDADASDAECRDAGSLSAALPPSCPSAIARTVAVTAALVCWLSPLLHYTPPLSAHTKIWRKRHFDSNIEREATSWRCGDPPWIQSTLALGTRYL